METQLCAEDFASKIQKSTCKIKVCSWWDCFILYYKQHSWKTSNLFAGKLEIFFQVTLWMKWNFFLCKISVSKIKAKKCEPVLMKPEMEIQQKDEG